MEATRAFIISSAKENIYFDLIKSSIAVTPKDAEIYYHLENDNIDIEYVKYPYSKIPTQSLKYLIKKLKTI